jgi:lysophospholipase L1-like esterase
MQNRFQSGTLATFIVFLFAHAAIAAPLKILPLGDSITYGWNYSSTNDQPADGGYRTYFAQRMSPATQIQWVGRIVRGPTQARYSEGWNGYSIRKLNNEIVQDAMTSGDPDVILLMAGTNDAWHGAQSDGDPLSDQQYMIPNMDSLLTHIFSVKPSVRVIVSTIPRIYNWGIFPEDGENYHVHAFNDALPDLINKHQGLNHDVGMVNSFALVALNEFSDGVHPNDLGYRHIADAFYQGFMLTVPEPSAMAILVIASIAHLRRPRRRI